MLTLKKYVHFFNFYNAYGNKHKSIGAYANSSSTKYMDQEKK